MIIDNHYIYSEIPVVLIPIVSSIIITIMIVNIGIILWDGRIYRPYFVGRRLTNRMEELVADVARRTGLTRKQARQATEEILAYLKEKLPVMMANQIEVVIRESEMADEEERKLLDIYRYP